MLTTIQKDEIIALIDDEKARLGSYRAVAKKCEISEATISQLRKGTYAGETNLILKRIGIALSYQFDDGNWKMAETHNFRTVTNVMEDARNECLWVCISNCAGAGKTAPANVYHNMNRRTGVFKITARVWSGRQFLLNIARTIGAEVPKGYASMDQLIDCITYTFKGMAGLHPLLIIDQGNSLRPSAIRVFIPLHNELEDILSVVMLGTDALEKDLKKGVRLNYSGYDEVDSRFGRKHIHLTGNTLSDTRAICNANGITDEEVQKRIFNDSDPTSTSIQNGDKISTIRVVEDTRRIKRLIKGERIKQKYHGYN